MADNKVLNPDTLANDYKEIKEKFLRIIGGLNDRQLNWRPQDDKWSISEIIAHLIVSGTQYLEEIRPAIKSAGEKKLTGEDPLRYSLMGKLMINMMEPPSKMKMKSPRSFIPGQTGARENMTEEFVQIQEDFIASIQSARQLDMNKIKLRSPAVRQLKLSLTEALGVNAAHQRRHLWQIEEMMRSDHFPQ